MAETACLISITPVLLLMLALHRAAAYFERGFDAHGSVYDVDRCNDPCGRPRRGSTLRFPLPGLPPEVGAGRRYRHRLRLHIMGAVPGNGVGTVGHVFGQPLLVASTSGVT